MSKLISLMIFLLATILNTGIAFSAEKDSPLSILSGTEITRDNVKCDLVAGDKKTGRVILFPHVCTFHKINAEEYFVSYRDIRKHKYRVIIKYLVNDTEVLEARMVWTSYKSLDGLNQLLLNGQKTLPHTPTPSSELGI